jgi:hypothetical protein
VAVAKKKSGEENHSDDDPLKLSTPKESAILGQEVELRNGVRMPHWSARGYWEILQNMQERTPDQLDALVAIVIYKRDPGGLDPMVLNRLRNRAHLRDDGSVDPEMSAVLEASYQEPTADRPLLRYPIVHTDRAQVDELNNARNRRRSRFFDHLLGEDTGDEGPTL